MNFTFAIATATILNSVALIAILVRVWIRPVMVAGAQADNQSPSLADKALIAAEEEAAAPGLLWPTEPKSSASDQEQSFARDNAIEKLASQSFEAAIPSQARVIEAFAPTQSASVRDRSIARHTRSVENEATSRTAGPHSLQRAIDPSPDLPRRSRLMPDVSGANAFAGDRTIATRSPSTPLRTRPRLADVGATDAAPKRNDYVDAVANIRRYLDSDRPVERVRPIERVNLRRRA